MATEGEDDRTTASADLTLDQIAVIQRDYEKLLVRNQSLLDEVVFILKDRISASEIKIHGVEPRIKELDSVIEKCRRKNISDISNVADVVGARIVCLFRSDIDRVGAIIRANFDIIEYDDKISAENGPLSYQSVHFSCRMPSRYRGPRYENTGNLTFEIQVRTLCMHAWAAVSHYLDYKGDWDVPADLKRALSALSGLFYVADNEFEQFYAARVQSREQAEHQTREKPEDIDLDTVTAFLRSRFPKRRTPRSNQISALVHEIKRAGYKSLSEVKSDIDRAENAFEEYEKAEPPDDVRRGQKKEYNAVGVARLSLALASEPFYLLQGRNKPDELVKYRRSLKS